MFAGKNSFLSDGLRWIKRRPAWLLLGLTLFLVVGVRVRLRDMPLERDEGEYAYAGQLILQGIPPYRDVYNMKLPGTYTAYAVILALFGQTPAAIHVGLLFVNVASILMLFLLGRRLLDDAAGAVAALSFGLLSLSPSVLGLAGHATHFVVAFALGGTLLLLSGVGNRARPERSGNPVEDQNSESGLQDRPQADANSVKPKSSPVRNTSTVSGSRQRTGIFVASGFLFGLAFLMKQHGIFLGLFGGLYLLGIALNQYLDRRAELRAKPWLNYPSKVQGLKSNLSTAALAKAEVSVPSLGDIFRRPLSFTAGFVLPYLLTCLLLWLGGVFPAFWFWTVSYARQYASMVSSEEAQFMFRTMIGIVIGPNLAFWILPLAGLGLMWTDRRLGNPTINISSHATSAPRGSRSGLRPSACSSIPNPLFLLITLLLCSLGSVGVGFYFRPHYFITLLPVMSLLIGVGVSRSLHSLHDHHGLESLLAIPILGLFALGSLAAVIGNGAVWFTLSPKAAVRQIYGTTLFSDCARAADLIKTSTGPQDQVAVIGSEPEIYFLSHRHSATGYIYTYPLMERHDYARTMQNEMTTEIERARPASIVYVQDPVSWVNRDDSDKTIFNWWEGYCRTNLSLVTTLDISGLEEPPGYEEKDSSEPASKAPKYLLIYKRR